MSRSLPHLIDDVLCRTQLALMGERPGLISFLFHSVALGDREDEVSQVTDYTQTLTVSELEGFIEHFKSAGYTFVSPDDIARGLPKGSSNVLITFDDGYFNNFLVLPVLERQQVPAIFFISTDYVESGDSFWWDVLYRGSRAEGLDSQVVMELEVALKRLRHDEIRAELVRRYGEEALRPIGDDDRPMTPDELQSFAQHPMVYLGNHTSHHGLLTNYDAEGVRDQVEAAQESLERMTGERPRMISYPNGYYSDMVVEVSERCGLDLGITVDPRPDGVEMDSHSRMLIGRFCFTQGFSDAATLRSFRARFSLRRWSGRERLSEWKARLVSR